MRVLVLKSSVFLACVSLGPGNGIHAAPVVATPIAAHNLPFHLPLHLPNTNLVMSPIPLASTSVSSPLPLIQPHPQPEIVVESLQGHALAAPAPVVKSSQFHAQDEFGQFSFGYENVNSKKTESKDAFGVTRGSYEYVDANGVLQIVNYIADPVNGFRVSGTNIPSVPIAVPVPAQVKETPEVAKATAEHLAAIELAKDQSDQREKREADHINLNPFAIQPLSPAGSVQIVPSFVPAAIRSSVTSIPLAPSVVPIPLSPSSPLRPAATLHPSAPLVGPVPASSPINPVLVNPEIPSVTSSQFHAQDEFGQFSFGYENIHSKRTESKDAAGVTRGGYEYVDANGVLQSVRYISDPINGFRVSGTNIPVGPENQQNVVTPTPLVAPVQVEDSPEVSAAKAEHLKAVAEALDLAEEV